MANPARGATKKGTRLYYNRDENELLFFSNDTIIHCKRQDDSDNLEEAFGSAYQRRMAEFFAKEVDTKNTPELVGDVTNTPFEMMMRFLKSTLVQFSDAFDARFIPQIFRDDVSQFKTHLRRFASLGNPEALTAAIASCERILRHPSFASTPRRFQRDILDRSAEQYKERFWERGAINDLNKSVSLLHRLGAITSDKDKEYTSYLNALGIVLRVKYEATGNAEDLEASIDACEQALRIASAEPAKLYPHLHNLSMSLEFRFDLKGDRQDLDRAIEASQKAVSEIHKWTDGFGETSNQLGNVLMTRYDLLGETKDLASAIDAREQAIKATALNSPELPGFLNVYASALLSRYHRFGNLQDLDAAVRAIKESIEKTAPTAIRRPRRLSNLGNVLLERYERTRSMQDLDAAIGSLEQAVAQSSSPERPGYLINLVAWLHDRCVHRRNKEDLKAAVEFSREIIQSIPGDSPDFTLAMHTVGATLLLQYGVEGHRRDLDGAISAFQQAYDKTPPQSPSLSGNLNNIGIAYRLRYELDGNERDLEHARSASRQACQLALEHQPSTALIASRHWGEWAFQRQSWQEASEAYRYALEAIEGLIRGQVLRSAKETWLSDAQDVPPRAAYALARTGDLRTAVEFIERGRAQLLSETLARNRADLERLAKSRYEKVYLAYQEASEAWRQAGTSEGRVPELPARAILREVDTRQVAQAKLDAAVDAIRKVPGYEDFLLPPTFDQLAVAAQGAPLIYIVVTPSGGLALIVIMATDAQNATILPVWLVLHPFCIDG